MADSERSRPVRERKPRIITQFGLEENISKRHQSKDKKVSKKEGAPKSPYEGDMKDEVLKQQKKSIKKKTDKRKNDTDVDESGELANKKVKIDPLDQNNDLSKDKNNSHSKKGRTVKKEKGVVKKGKASSSRSRVKDEVEEDGFDEDVKVKSKKKTSKKGHSCRKLVGAHVSSQGGAHNAVYNAADIGATSFAMFLKSQRQWKAKPLDEKVVAKFKDACKEYRFSPDKIIPHGSYLLNCGSPNPDTLRKSRDALVDELMRCEKLGLTLYNFHPGSTCGEISVKECIALIAESINIAHSKTKYVRTVIENMCCQGNTIGGKFEELRGIIDKVKDKSRIGVCLDTCHAFAAGFDLATDSGYKKFISDFDKIVGFKYLDALHLNDSKGVKGCHLDRHENIGKGHIGLEGFRRVMTDPNFDDIPMVLETPAGMGYHKEIQILHGLCDG
ncbi:probable endonuclease 4 isoform X1 [Haliotis rufescens]|uniref:probable endonuclease 4 isoform X1 n=1 Tax=Haliotis rufescens TaxID=6454 RepID=UPI00201EA6A5|nr:probable endonuclease 4 isoform X1 [Haliotis rufescens]